MVLKYYDGYPNNSFLGFALGYITTAPGSLFVLYPPSLQVTDESTQYQYSIKMIPVPRPIIMPTPLPMAILQENSYANLKTVTLFDYHAIKANRSCIVPTVRQCLQDLYRRVSTDATPLSTPLASQADNAIALSNQLAARSSNDNLPIGDIVVYSFFLLIVAGTILGVVIAACYSCCCAKDRKKWRRNTPRQAREDLELENRNDDAAADSDDDERADPSPAEAPSSPKSSFWKSITTRKASPGSGPRSSASTGRSGFIASHPYTPRPESFAVTAGAGRRAPSVFDGAEGISIPPPVYEMVDLDPILEDGVSEAPRTSEDATRRERLREMKEELRETKERAR